MKVLEIWNAQQSHMEMLCSFTIRICRLIVTATVETVTGLEECGSDENKHGRPLVAETCAQHPTP
jgi:hypothetical protein